MTSDITGVRDTMDGVTMQLAILVQAAQNGGSTVPPATIGIPPSTTDPRHIHRQPSDACPAGQLATQAQVIPPPAELRADANKHGFVDANIKREEMSHQKSDGKASFINDIFADRLIGKPYMFIERVGVRTLKEKLDQGCQG